MSGLTKLEEFFFKAMQKGWAFDAKGVPMRHFRGWNKMEYHVEYDDPDWEKFRGLKLRDCWGIDPDSDKPSGHTIIFEYTHPVWVMHYGDGGYGKELLPFLRECLMENYCKGVFLGGRGPAEHLSKKDDLLYTNNTTGSFMHFSGSEGIWIPSSDEPSLGSHNFWGGSLVYLE